MNPTDLKTITEFKGSIYTDWEITKKIQEEGWFLIAVRTESHGKDESQEFIYLLGHPDKI